MNIWHKAVAYIGAAALLVTGTVAVAQEQWPTRTVRIVVASSPGGAPDRFARHYAEKLAPLLGQSVIVENRPGAAGAVAAATVSRSDDGHTLFWGFTSIFGINPHVYTNLPLDLNKDLVPVGATLKQGLMLVTNLDFPPRTLPELVEYAKARPGEISYASYGIAGYPHLAMELLQDEAKINMVHVPYGKQALLDVMSGQVPMVVEPLSTAMPQIDAKTVRPVAYTGAQRHPNLPDVPTFSEVYPSLTEIAGIHGVWMPASTSDSVVARMNEALNHVTAMPEIVQRIRDVNCEPLSGTPADLAAVVQAEYERWGKVVAAKNIKMDN